MRNSNWKEDIGYRISEMMKHFSEHDMENVVDVILADEKLFKFAMNLVMQRINKGVLHDTAWCIQLIDFSIDHVLAEVDVLGILHDHIKTDDFDDEKDDDCNLYPNFSFSEPTFQNSPQRHDHLKADSLQIENTLTIEIENNSSFVEGESNLMNISYGNDSEASTVRMVVVPQCVPTDEKSSPLHIGTSDADSSSTSFDKFSNSAEIISDDNVQSMTEDDHTQQVENNGSVQNCEHAADTSIVEKKSVTFTDRIVSEVYYRDKTDPIEKHHIYYSHEEEDFFTRQQNREYLKADAMGISWIEWINLYAEQELEDNTNFNDSDPYEEDYFEDSIDHF